MSRCPAVMPPNDQAPAYLRRDSRGCPARCMFDVDHEGEHVVVWAALGSRKYDGQFRWADSRCPDGNAACDGSDLLHGDWCEASSQESSRP